jgi:hypothetical protein
LPMNVQLFYQHWLKKVSFLQWIVFPPVVKSVEFICMDIFLGSVSFHWSVYLSLPQYHKIMIIITI